MEAIMSRDETGRKYPGPWIADDHETGLPKDQVYLECGLPPFLADSVSAMKAAWDKLDRGEKYMRWDCDYCNLQTDINNAEVNQIISTEQAWYLREKYLRIERARSVDYC